MDQTSSDEKALQKRKYEDIIEILLTAGYFRVRISNLSPFDKVVGGLCWCITNSGEDVDVDILFQENSNIGQKIAMSEAIVKALRKMNCPSPLQPNQIQGGIGGSDFPALQPVIVWLIKKCFERKEQREAEMRSFAIMQFSKNYELPMEHKVSEEDVSIDLKRVLNANRANRQFKRQVKSDESEETRVQSCLLEFGESFFGAGKGGGKDGKGNEGGSSGGGGSGGGGGSSLEGSMVRINLTESGDVSLANLGSKGSSGKGGGSDLSAFDKKLAQAAKEALKEEELYAENASKVEAELMKEMSHVSNDDGVGSSAFSNLNSDEISRATASYQAEMEENQKRIESNLASGQLGSAAVFKRQRQNLMKQLEELDAKSIEIRANYDIIFDKLSLAEDERASAIEYNGQLRDQLIKIAQLEAASKQQNELASLKKLIALNESLKKQEGEFKASCKAQMQDYKARIQAIQNAEGDESEEAQKLQDIEDMYAKMNAKYDKLRQLLAETNIEVSASARIMDDIPTRTELIQYERRFVELYQQVGYKLEETRKYYDTYNTMDTTLGFLQKEIKLLNSIHETFNEAMASPGAKTAFLEQFASIIKGVEDSHKKQRSNFEGKDKTFEEMKLRHQQLVDQQRLYFKTVKDFQDECNKNEWLLQKLEQLQG